MKSKAVVAALVASLVAANLSVSPRILAAEMKPRIIRMAKPEIDPAQLDAYKAALKEEIETSVRLEPGVFGLYAVSDKKAATKVTILEMYADDAAYKEHLETPHFKNYKASTKDMIKSLELVETEPVVLGTKAK